VQGIGCQPLEDKSGFEAGSAFKISVSQLANSGTRVQMGLTPDCCNLIDCGTDLLALIAS